MTTIAHPHELRKGDVILSWIGEEDEPVDVSDQYPWQWSVTRVETESESSVCPLYDGWVRVHMSNSSIDFPEGAEVTVRRAR